MVRGCRHHCRRSARRGRMMILLLLLLNVHLMSGSRVT
jgi:hypothetical protein